MADTDHITTAEKSPCFQFYPRDYLSDAKTRAMTFKQRGMYWDLCCHCWLEGGLPLDPKEIARILGISTPARFESADWPAISRCFRIVEGEGHQHPRLERERRAQAVNREKRSHSGKQGAAKRWASQTDGTAMPAPMALHGLSSSSSSSSPRKEWRVDDATEKLAGEFMEQYPGIFARCRAGAAYHTSRLNMERDFDNARELAKGWPSLPRLLAMLEVFLLAKNIGDKNMPGTPGQFLHMAPEMDALLRKNGR